jgi:ketosteroid isomerase-like protein
MPDWVEIFLSGKSFFLCCFRGWIWTFGGFGGLTCDFWAETHKKCKGKDTAMDHCDNLSYPQLWAWRSAMSISDSIKAEMQKVNGLFGETVVKGRNFAALDQIYTIDARILPPGADVIEGRENIKGFWQAAVVGMNVQDAKLVSVNADPAGDSIIEVGRAQLFLPEGKSAEVKYVVEWKQEDGAWKWHTDIWNMNA